MTGAYYRPLAQIDEQRPTGAQQLAGGWCWFDRVERITRAGERRVVAATDVPDDILSRLAAPRRDMVGLTLDRPRIMGIVNVTPDSFSDGGLFQDAALAVEHARQIAGASDILDIGGESTRPGAADVPEKDEVARVIPVIEGLCDAGRAISVDTRKSGVARAAIAAGAAMVNDVSALSWDPGMARTVADAGVPVCLMHAQGDPATMQKNPRYDDVLLDVYDYLSGVVEQAVASGIPRDRVIVDPGIGFGKTVAHNLALIRGLSLFHGLGCAVLLGASRKRFIGTLTGTEVARERLPGSLAMAQAAVLQGVQIVRVHDINETRQAIDMTMALIGQ